MNPILRCAGVFTIVSGLAACASPRLVPTVINESITDGCHKQSTTVNVNEKTGEHVGAEKITLSDEPVSGCQSFVTQSLLVNNPAYTLEGRALNAASLLMTWSAGTPDGQYALKQALQITGQTPETLLRVIVLDALSNADDADSLAKILSIHRKDLFPKFEDDAPRIVEDELERKGLTIQDIENDLMNETRKTYGHLLSEKSSNLTFKPQADGSIEVFIPR